MAKQNDEIQVPRDPLVFTQDIVLKDILGKVRIKLNTDGSLVLYDSREKPYCFINLVNDQVGGFIGKLRFGGGKNNGGEIYLFPKTNDISKDTPSISIDGNSAVINVGGHNKDGKIVLQDGNGIQNILLDGNTPNINLGHDKVSIDGNLSRLSLKDGENIIVANANVGRLHLNGDDGILLDGAGKTLKLNGNDGILLDGPGKTMKLGGSDKVLIEASRSRISLNNKIIANGELSKVSLNGDDGILLNGATKTMTLGGGKVEDGILSEDGILLEGGKSSINLGNSIILRGGGAMNMSVGKVFINGIEGDIILNHGDCAEDFEVLNKEAILPGTVMVINNDGKMRPCDLEYDKRVTGIVSGAGESKPGIILGRKPENLNSLPIALTGCAYCFVEAENIPIEVGDLLTTSNIYGHAMKASEPNMSFGAVIGKAMAPLTTGRGLIPVLISLQ